VEDRRDAVLEHSTYVRGSDGDCILQRSGENVIMVLDLKNLFVQWHHEQTIYPLDA
jgi:hypothetical protein